MFTTECWSVARINGEKECESETELKRALFKRIINTGASSLFMKPSV